MTNHQASSYTVPPEIAVLFSYHSTVKLILRKLMSVHWFEMDLQSVNSSFQESTITTTSTQWPSTCPNFLNCVSVCKNGETECYSIPQGYYYSINF